MEAVLSSPWSRRRERRRSRTLVRRRRRRRRRRRSCGTARKAKAQGRHSRRRGRSIELHILGITTIVIIMSPDGHARRWLQAKGLASEVVEANERVSATNSSKQITANTLPASGLITRTFPPLTKVKIHQIAHINVEVKWRTKLDTSSGFGDNTNTDQGSKCCLTMCRHTSAMLLDLVYPCLNLSFSSRGCFAVSGVRLSQHMMTSTGYNT